MFFLPRYFFLTATRTFFLLKEKQFWAKKKNLEASKKILGQEKKLFCHIIKRSFLGIRKKNM